MITVHCGNAFKAVCTLLPRRWTWEGQRGGTVALAIIVARSSLTSSWKGFGSADLYSNRHAHVEVTHC